MHSRRLPLVLPLLAADCPEDDALVTPSVEGTAQGRVTVDGEALSGVTVHLSGAMSATATTAADGSYSFASVPAGAHLVTGGDAVSMTVIQP